MDYPEISEELKAKAAACKTTEELFALAKSEGVDISEEDLSAISGGKWECENAPCTVDAPDTTPCPDKYY
ncbi:MAG: Nif11-like leader peptide family natural product precursor [Atopobiaceae bacterium]|nr:Nif11-like leader peptide family natural product precursor [Atopobiaceae bacterium]